MNDKLRISEIGSIYEHIVHFCSAEDKSVAIQSEVVLRELRYLELLFDKEKLEKINKASKEFIIKETNKFKFCYYTADMDDVCDYLCKEFYTTYYAVNKYLRSCNDFLVEDGMIKSLIKIERM